MAPHVFNAIKVRPGDEGDMYYRNATGLLVPVGGTIGDGKVPTAQADDTVEWEAGSVDEAQVWLLTQFYGA